MRWNRQAVGALAATATMLVGGGVAVAASGDGAAGTRCEARLARIAERHGVTVEQLQAGVKTRLLARIDAAENAGRITPQQAAKLRERVADASLCGARKRVQARFATPGMLVAAARFLGLDREELRVQLPGTSLAALAEKEGTSAQALEAAMVAPAKARLAKAAAAGRITQARADVLLDKLEDAAHRLATHVFPKK